MSDNLTMKDLVNAYNQLARLKPQEPHLTITKTRRRTWRQRLFTKPWQPWRKNDILTAPDLNVYVTDSAIVCHPVVAAELKPNYNQTHMKRH